MSDIVEGFTPGPWEVGTKGNGTPGYVYCNNSLGSAVAIVYGEPLKHTVFPRTEEEANARLIASAPDMAAEITRLRAALSTAREDALREAARMADEEAQGCERFAAMVSPPMAGAQHDLRLMHEGGAQTAAMLAIKYRAIIPQPMEKVKG